MLWKNENKICKLSFFLRMVIFQKKGRKKTSHGKKLMLLAQLFKFIGHDFI